MDWIRKIAPAHKNNEKERELFFVRSILRSLRGGLDLGSAVQSAKSEQLTYFPAQWPRYKEVQIQNKTMSIETSPSFLNHLLAYAKETGCSLSTPLSIYGESLENHLLMQSKVASLSSQAKAQATVLTWMPIFLFIALCFVDFQGFLAIWSHDLNYLFTALLCFLIAGGSLWIQSLQAQLLEPTGSLEKIETQWIPEIVLQWIVCISSGMDVETSWQKILMSTNQKEVQILQSRSGKYLQQLAKHSSENGTPIKDELLSFLQEHLKQIHYQTEGKAQKLPVKLLAPLFLCFLPASLLVIAMFLLPVFGEI